MSSPVDYDQVAGSYDRRYAERDYAGIEGTLRDFVAGAKRVSEVGCGTGHWLDVLSPGGHAIGIDPSREMLARARAGRTVSLVRGRAESLPLADDSLDAVVVVHALHHFTDKAAFIEEAGRTLRVGGRIMIVGLDPSQGLDSWFVYEYFERTRDLDRDRYPSCEAIGSWLDEAGFDQIETTVVERIRESRPAAEHLAGGALTKHSTSQLSLLEDHEFESGVARIRRDVRHAKRRGDPLELTADLHIHATTGRRA